MVAGWIGRKQATVIEYLENSAFGERLTGRLVRLELLATKAFSIWRMAALRLDPPNAESALRPAGGAPQ